MPQTIHQLFSEQVKLTPNAIALQMYEEKMTYLELENRANQIANYLIESGLKKDSIVAVSLNRGFELIASLIGILKAGCAYLPLDKEYPKDRLEYMLQHSQADFLICDHDEFQFKNTIHIKDTRNANFNEVSEDGSLAYIIYTSGSTGFPKGVCLDHSALINLLENQALENKNLRTLQFTPVSFDVHFQEIFSTLTSGGELILINELTRLDFANLLKTISEKKIERLFLPFVALNKLAQIAQTKATYPIDLKFVTTAGEQLRITSSIREFFSRTKAKLYNHYGPSETHVVTSKLLEGDPALWPELPSIGYLLKGNKYLLNTLDGGETELLIGGKSVGLGYLNDCEKTDEKFFTQDGTRYYRTGDIVRIENDEITFIRRVDNQIKIRGFRVELGEIESAIEKIIPQSNVTTNVFQQSSGENYICAYVSVEFNEKELRSKLIKILPDYMIPRFIMNLKSFPLTPSGKIDKKALPKPEFRRPELINDFIAAKTELEIEISKIWTDVLELDRIGINDSFFELGGTSLGAMTILEKINLLGKRKMTVGDLFSLSTIEKQAKFLEGTNKKIDLKKKNKTHDIAIIAMTGMFPGAEDIEGLKKLLENEESGLEGINQEEVHSIHSTIKNENGYVFVKGEIKTAKEFDHQFFGLTPREAELMDPQQRKFLELSYNALEASGYLKLRDDYKIGVFAGSANNTYQKNLNDFQDKVQKFGEFNVMVLNEKDYIATKTAYKLGLRGPALSIHTGCSTSLVSIIQAVDSIRNGHCELALAGGVTIEGQRNKGHLHQQDSILSKDGYCRAFDEKSSGTIFTEGAGVIILKSLDDAIADGDYIYSVIKGVGINNDGSDKMSFSAPSSSGQQDVIIQAMLDADISPNAIDFVETHGTGTPIGDPIELNSIQKAYEALGIEKDKSILIGSLKTNIGHLTAAAGVSGLIKTVLSLKNQTVYKNLYFEQANSKLAIDQTNFKVADKKYSLIGDKHHAGVSSFGIGGTNAHVVLSSYENTISKEEDEIFFLSSKSEESLEIMINNLDKSSLNRAISRSLSTRENLAYRGFRTKNSSKWIKNKTKKNAKSIFMFPGQGSQYINMGKELRDFSKSFFDLTEYCFNEANKYLNKDIREVLYNSNDEIINNTYFTQPVLYIFEYALAKLLEEHGVRPSMMLGHSVGEFVAATLNNVFSLEDGIKAICKRSELMSELPGGVMLSVALCENDLIEILPTNLDIAAINAEKSIAVAGPLEAIESFEKILNAQNIANKRLHTSHAFHSRMMNPMLEAYKEFLNTLSLSLPDNAFFSTVTGKLEKDIFATSEYWANHIAKTVRFYPTMKTLVASLDDSKESIFIEVGPRVTLSTLTKRMDKTLTVLATSSRQVETEKENFLNCLGELFTLGESVDFNQNNLLKGSRNSDYGLTVFKKSEHWLDKNLKNEIKINKNIKGSEKMSANQKVEQLKKIIADVFEDASGIDILEYSDDTCFFEMGMDSLFLTQVALKLKSEFKVELSFRQLTEEYADLQSLCAFYLDKYDFKDVETPLLEETKVENKDEVPTSMTNVNTSNSTQQAATTQPQMVQMNINTNAAGVEGIIQSQLQLMQNQLNLLAGVGMSMSTNNTTTTQTTQEMPVAASTPVVNSEEKRETKKFELKTEVNNEKDEEHNLKAELNNTKKAFGAIARISTEKEDENNTFINDFIKEYNEKTKGSKNFTQDARKSHADPRAVTGFKPEHKEMVYPIVVKESKNQKLIDIDGNEYIDMLCGFGSNFFGNRNDHIQKTILEQMDKGFEIGPQHPLTKEVSEMINELTGNERSAFCNTGSEAVLGAMRIARTISGKKKIVSFNGSYHGINDEVIIKGSKKGATFPAAPGINKDAVSNMIVLEYGEEESYAKLLEIAKSGDLAAVIVEPVQSRRSDFHPKEFLQKVREFTLQNDICLIFDEVITGFRIALGGAQEYFGVRADICTYGKIVGGGMPIGVVSGKAKYLDALDGGHWQYGDESTPTVGVTYFAGTFVRHPLALAAAKGALEILKEIGRDGLKALNEKADKWVEEINHFSTQVGAPLKFANFGALMKPKWDADYKNSDVFFAYLRHQGLHCYDGFPWFINLAHTDAELDKAKTIIKSSIARFQNEGIMQGESIYTADVMHSHLPPRADLKLGRNAEGFACWVDANNNEVNL